MIKFLKWTGITVGGLIGLLVVVILGAYLRGRWLVGRSPEFTAAAPAHTIDSAAITRGRHIVQAIAPCAMCHGAGLKGEMFPIPAPIVAMAAPNLTKGRGGVGDNTPDQWARAIRGGIGRDGRQLIIMPSAAYARMSDADLSAVIAYLNTIPPIDNALPVRKVGLAGAIMAGAGMLPLGAKQVAKLKPTPMTVQPGETVAYGEYLVALGTCAECHGPGLVGAQGHGEVPAPSLHTNARNWTEEQFRATMRTGKTPEGRALIPTEMPWPHFGNMTDAELKAIWLYIRSLPT